MKIFAISVIYLLSLGAFALETREQILSRQDFYSGQSYSLIDWEGLDTVQWLDFDEWKDDIALKDAEPSWRRNLRERGLSEMIGRALECVGECKLFRGDGASSLRLRSQVMEGDEIVTSKDSYAWLFLMDGTMLRISPNTSISFKEINISKDVVFHHARLNYGHALWLARQNEQYPVNSLKETDALFLPLNLFEANIFPEAKPINETGFYVDQKTEPASKLQYERLNQLIVENNEWAGSKKSILFLVMQNGTVIAENPMLEAVALPGNESYVKNRLSSEVGLSNERTTTATAYMRGYSNDSSQSLTTGQWYRYDDRGRNLEQLSDSSKFSMVEYLTQRIPTINVARELFLKELSKFVFDQKISRLKLAARWGYRLWDGNLENGEIKRRAEFMVEYSRRSETTLLVETDKFNRMMKERGETVTASRWSDEFYLRAIDAYALSPERARNQAVEGEILNSTTKPLWKIMNARKNF
tara:strand:+ start:12722 stop:14137 length:1416 start_codon:yes stop_codon:yes gene_type:complete